MIKIPKGKELIEMFNNPKFGYLFSFTWRSVMNVEE